MIFISITYGLQRSYYAASNSKGFEYVTGKEPVVFELHV